MMAMHYLAVLLAGGQVHGVGNSGNYVAKCLLADGTVAKAIAADGRIVGIGWAYAQYVHLCAVILIFFL